MTTLFALGSNGSGQLGLGHTGDVSVPKPVLFHDGGKPDSPITRVAAGGNHTTLLTRAGELFWSGDASSGACGKVSRLEQVEPPAEEEQRQGQNFCFRKLDLGLGTSSQPFSVGLVAATWEATVLTELDVSGRSVRAYSLGTGLKGELGQGELIVRTPAAAPIADFPPPGTTIVALAAGVGHVVTVLSTGEVYGWGNGRKGQLGTPEGVVHRPRKVEGLPFRVVRALCGREFTCLVGEPGRGEVMVLGSDKFGVRSSAPTSAPGWRDIGASWGSVFVLKDNGAVESWGRDDHGQLVPPGLPAVSRTAIGSEHALVLTHDGDVLAWGWGEHGNCGPQVDNGDVKGRWNVIASSKYIPPGSAITGVGAGCATSWIFLDSPS